MNSPMTITDKILSMTHEELVDSLGKQYMYLDLTSLRILYVNGLILFNLVDEPISMSDFTDTYNEDIFDVTQPLYFDKLIESYNNSSYVRRIIARKNTLVIIMNLISKNNIGRLPTRLEYVEVTDFDSFKEWYSYNYYTRRCGNYHPLPVCYSAALSYDTQDECNKYLRLIRGNTYDSLKYEFKYIPPRHILIMLNNGVKFSHKILYREMLTYVEYMYVTYDDKTDDEASVIEIINNFDINPGYIVGYPSIYEKVFRNFDIKEIRNAILDTRNIDGTVSKVTSKWLKNARNSIHEDLQTLYTCCVTSMFNLSLRVNNEVELSKSLNIANNEGFTMDKVLNVLATTNIEYRNWATNMLDEI